MLRDDNSVAGSLGSPGSGLGQRLYVQQDANHDVTALTDTSGNVKQRFVEDPYGAVTVLSPTWANATDAYSWVYGFQGGRVDPVTGLYHFGARDYSPTLGRWMQMDPAGQINGPDLYQMELSAPATLTDPSGLAVPNYGRVPYKNLAPFVNSLTGSVAGVGAGAATAYATRNPALAGAVAGAASNLVTQSMNKADGSPNINWSDVVHGAASGAGWGAFLGVGGGALSELFPELFGAGAGEQKPQEQTPSGESRGGDSPEKPGQTAKRSIERYQKSPDGGTVDGPDESSGGDFSDGIVARNGTRVTGFTKHGVDRAIGDTAQRAGTTPQAIIDALRNPLRIVSGIDGEGRPYQRFYGNDARVVVNPQTGKIVSVNPLSGAGAQ